MDYDFLLRIVLAGVAGAAIGLEREKRLKEAGLRTHFLVAVGSAIFMLISKYAFYDILGDDIVLDPSRIAAQVVSGVGFLGAGMILVQRQSIHGLTTAAGIWTTAAIGLAFGGGMYGVGVFGTLLVLLGLEFLKRVFRFALPANYHLIIETGSSRHIEEMMKQLTALEINVGEYEVKVKEGVYFIKVKFESGDNIDRNELIALLQQTVPDIHSVKWR
jgi:putative Mg2+ transporter-C (MgtC) family protein